MRKTILTADEIAALIAEQINAARFSMHVEVVPQGQGWTVRVSGKPPHLKVFQIRADNAATELRTIYDIKL